MHRLGHALSATYRCSLFGFTSLASPHRFTEILQCAEGISFSFRLQFDICYTIIVVTFPHRFTEILQCAEGITEDDLRKAIRKSRLMFNHPENGAGGVSGGGRVGWGKAQGAQGRRGQGPGETGHTSQVF